MTAKEIVENLELETYEYCDKQKIIKAKEDASPKEQLAEIIRISEELDMEQISYTIDTDSNFVSLFDHKI